METLANIDHISLIRIYDVNVDSDFYYLEQYKFFGIEVRKEGFRCKQIFGGSVYREREHIERSGRFSIEGNRVMENPHMEIIMNNGCVTRKYFKYMVDLKKYISQFDNNTKFNFVYV